VRIQLFRGTEFVPLRAKIDTGAECCVFQREYGRMLNIDVESGRSIRLSTATTSFEAFGHELEIECLGIKHSTMVYFAGTPDFKRNVLGRTGWLDQVRFGLIDRENQLYLSPYNSAKP
jgi:hypothetical protein